MSSSASLFTIKLLHTLIWGFFVAVIGYVLYSGLSGEITAFTWVAIGLVLLEALVLLLFRWHCPLTVLARRYSASTRDNFDIFLPEWLARHNKVIFTTLYLLGVLRVLWRVWGE